MRTSWLARSAPLVLAVSSVLGTASSSAGADDWKVSVAPYFWASDLALDVEIQGDPVLGTEIDISDILSDLEAAFPVHAEMSTPKGGFFLDVNWVSTTSKAERNVTRLPGETKFRVDMTLGIYELGAFYHPTVAGFDFDVLFGVRLIDRSQDIDIQVGDGTETSSETSGSLTDAFMGIRAGGPIGGNWGLMVRGDVGTGDTDFTWNAMGTVGYAFGSRKQFDLRMGWRQMTAEVQDTGTRTTVDSTITMKGPIAGFNWTF